MRIFLAAALAVVATPAFAANQPAKVIWSYPTHESTVAEPVKFVQLKFDQDVDFLSLDIEKPDSEKVVLYDAFTDPLPLPKGREFAVTLPAEVSTPGQYYLNYAASVTHADKTTDAIAGYTGFEIAEPEAEGEAGQ